MWKALNMAKFGLVHRDFHSWSDTFINQTWCVCDIRVLRVLIHFYINYSFHQNICSIFLQSYLTVCTLGGV